jgi:hypothetical protein
MVMLILYVMIISGCAFSSVDRPNVNQFHNQFQQSKRLEVGKQDAIEMTKIALLSMGYEIHMADQYLGLVRTKTRNVPVPEIGDCGTWNSNIIQGAADSVLIVNIAAPSLTESDVSLDHQINTNFTGRNLYGAPTRIESYPCASKGVIENQFWTAIQKIIASRK